MKIVINADYGGFSISKKAAEYMATRGHRLAQAELSEHAKPLDPDNPFDAITIRYGKERQWYGYGYAEGFDGGYDRADPLLVEAVEALGEEAGGSMACLKVVEIPDGVSYEIDNYDGREHIAESHRTWG
jgi:hypothetical protein